MKTLHTALWLIMSGTAFAASEIPLNELGFVDRIPYVNKAEIVDQLGEPSKIYNIADKNSGAIVASIWHYHYLNTSEEGEYYKTTELDFIGDRVVNIVFSTVEDSEDDTAQTSPSGSECTPAC